MAGILSIQKNMCRTGWIVLAVWGCLWWIVLSAQAQTSTDMLRRKLSECAGKEVMFGHHDDTLYGFEWENEEGRSDTYGVCGAYPAVMSFDLHPLERFGHDGNFFNRMREAVRQQHARGGISVFCWHADNPVTWGNAWDVKDTAVVHQILTDARVKYRFTMWIDSIADFLNSLTDKYGQPIPVVFRPYHENHGSWFWWGENLCTADEYKALWQLTLDRLRFRGVNHLIYAYSPTAYFRDMEDYLHRYPGDEVIDILGFDFYMSRRMPTVREDRAFFVRQLHHAFALLAPYAQAKGKVLALTETGIQADSVDGWWTLELLPVLKKYPVSYVVTWQNATAMPSHCWGIYPGHYLEQDFIDFYRDPYTLFVND